MKMFVFDGMFFIPEESKEAALEKYKEVCYNLWETEGAEPESCHEFEMNLVSDMIRVVDYMAAEYDQAVSYIPFQPLERQFEITPDVEKNDFLYKYCIRLNDDDWDGVYSFKLCVNIFERKDEQWEYHSGENNILIAVDDEGNISGDHMFKQIKDILYPEDKEN